MRHGLGNSQNNRRVHGDANLPAPLFCLSRLTAMYDNDISSTEDGGARVMLAPATDPRPPPIKRDETVTAEQVKQLRKQLDYTQAELATVLGVHKLTVSAWEMGRRNVSRPTEIALKSLRKKRQKQRKRSS